MKARSLGGRRRVKFLPMTSTATPVSAAAKQQHQNNYDKDQFHGNSPLMAMAPFARHKHSTASSRYSSDKSQSAVFRPVPLGPRCTVASLWSDLSPSYCLSFSGLADWQVSGESPCSNSANRLKPNDDNGGTGTRSTTTTFVESISLWLKYPGSRPKSPASFCSNPGTLDPVLFRRNTLRHAIRNGEGERGRRLGGG
jgi:hypothetical protein